jgi:regulator of cell morphogenesis and NO signaling
MSIDASTRIGDLAATIPGAARLFEEYRLEYCCKGARSLREACEARGAPLPEVLEKLESAALGPSTDDGPPPDTMPLRDLIARILAKHHTFTRTELDRLGPLLAKVVAVHGNAHPELAQIRAVFAAIDEDLRPHLAKEEIILFPFIEELEDAARTRRRPPPPPFGTVDNPVRMMMMEHDRVGDLLLEMRRLTSDYALPAGACASYGALYRGLEALERDLHEHIHLESNVLFPRAVDLERG